MTQSYEILDDPEYLRDAIELTSKRANLPPALVEKDLWVTFVLKHLCTDSLWKNNLLFKGGTCLSKCYDAIDRFSEDVDLLLDWRVLGYDSDGPAIESSRKKQDNSNVLLRGRLKQFVDDQFVPTLRNDISNMIHRPFEIVTNGTDVIFRYPSSYGSSYVKNEVIIEMGPRGKWGTPDYRIASSYISQNTVSLGDSAKIRCIPLEQAYYEKIQVLHSSASRGKVPDRYSRHYYDVYKIHHKLGRITFDFDSLNSILEYNRRFFPGAGFGYDTMKKGTYRLMPTEGMMDALRDDYKHMENMIFGEIPSFDDILSEIGMIEEELNSKTE